VFLTFQAQGTWIYVLSLNAKQQIKSQIAGKTTQQAVILLASLSGVKHVAISFQGFGDASKLPRESRYIHLNVVV
jgi:VCBS repeat-containing protein